MDAAGEGPPRALRPRRELEQRRLVVSEEFDVIVADQGARRAGVQRSDDGHVGATRLQVAQQLLERPRNVSDLRKHLCRGAFEYLYSFPAMVWPSFTVKSTRSNSGSPDRSVDSSCVATNGASGKRARVQAAACKILVRRVECARHARRPCALLVHQLSVDAVDAGGDRASTAAPPARHARSGAGLVERRATSGPVPDVRQRHRWPQAVGWLPWPANGRARSSATA